MNKSMKPARAWVNLETSGGIAKCDGYPVLFANKTEAAQGTRNGWGERPLRVRIIEDAAVERVIAILRTTLRLEGYDHNVIKGAIRDLGGRP